MREQVVDILSQARRRLLVARTAGAAAVLVATAAMASASMEVGWALSRLSYGMGLCACSLPIIAGLLLLLAPIKMSLPRLRAPLPRLAAALLIAVGVAGMLVFLSPIRRGIPAVLIPAGLLPAGALLAVLFVCLRPPPLRQVAVMLDLRLNLRERLSTAMELIERGSVGPQVAGAGLSEVIFAQAVGQARKAGVERMRFDSVSRPAAGALGLSLLLAVALLALPGEGQQFFNSSAEIDSAFASMTPKQKHTLAEELANAAKSAPTPQTDQDLQKASEAALRNDPQALKDALARLNHEIEIGHLKVVNVESPEAVEGHVADVPNDSGPIANTPPPGNQAGAAGNSPPPANSPDTAQVVMPPPGKSLPINQTPAAGASTEGGSYVSFDKAWEQAVSQANQSLRDGQVPLRCRQLVRDYFLTKD
jgi:hypothetical protein